MPSMSPRELIHDLLLSAESGVRDNIARAKLARHGVEDPTKPYGQSNLSLDEIEAGYQERLRDVSAAQRWFREQVGGR